MNKIKFTATKLANSGKKGVLTPDEDGYYTLAIGGLNCFNSANEFYDSNNVVSLFEKSSSFMRKIKAGYLYGELGHPAYQKGWSDDEYINRIYKIDESNLVCHFKDVWLVNGAGPSSPITIMAKVIPFGSKGYILKESLDNPNINTAFSIRSIVGYYYERGIRHKVITSVITFDFVVEPGIANANKWDSPGLEHNNQDVLVTKRMLEKIVNDPVLTIGVESNKDIILDSIKQIENNPKLNIPKSILTNW